MTPVSLHEGAARAVAATIRAGSIRYSRRMHLPRLLRLFRAEIPAAEPEATRFILGRLTVEARRERRRASAAHWTYDLNRHIALMQALEAERLHLADLMRRAGA